MWPQNAYVEILAPSVMILGGGAYGRWLAQEGEALMNGISALIEEAQESFPLLLPCEDTVKFLWIGTKLSPDSESASILPIDFSASRTVRNKCCCLNHSACGIFVTAAQTD